MNKAIITTLLALVALTGQAQEIRTNEPTLDDYLQLLKAKGYIAYSFDTKDFKGKQYEPVIMEYAKGKEAKDVYTEGSVPIVYLNAVSLHKEC